MGKPKTPIDLYVTNGWYIEIPSFASFPGLQSPHFQTLEGLGIDSGTVDIVDAGTNIKYKFPTQILDFTEITLTRTLDGGPDDAALDILAQLCLRQGVKVPVVSIVKMHNQQEVFRVQAQGFRLLSEKFPTMDINGEDKFLMTYRATIDQYQKV
jgi:hypothetical protein